MLARVMEIDERENELFEREREPTGPLSLGKRNAIKRELFKPICGP